MLRYTKLEHRFVQFIPEQLEPGVLHISMEYATAAHSCCCGCGLQVITPFTPTDWKLTYDGETISLWPSIGNWNFPCRSHYIVRQSRIIAAGPWNDKQIENGRTRDKKRKEEHFDRQHSCDVSPSIPQSISGAEDTGLWSRLLKKMRKRLR